MSGIVVFQRGQQRTFILLAIIEIGKKKQTEKNIDVKFISCFRLVSLFRFECSIGHALITLTSPATLQTERNRAETCRSLMSSI